MTLSRVVAACGLLALGAGLAWYGWSIIDNIWGAGDSPAWAYVMWATADRCWHLLPRGGGFPHAAEKGTPRLTPRRP